MENAMRTIDLMTPSQLADLRDAGRGHLIDGAGPLLDKADEQRKREREEGSRSEDAST